MKLLGRVLLAIVLLAIGFVVYCNLKVMSYSRLAYSSLDDLPDDQICLVLGTSDRLTTGAPNLFFRYRMQAASAAYEAGKCRKLVVSGDNRFKSYNEPRQMRRSLVALGVPDEVIYSDYAGGRTLDSAVRFKHVFGQSQGIVISQEFHNARAIYIAQSQGLALVGFNAQEVDAQSGLRTNLREVLARVLAVLDVDVLHTKARHYGEPILL